jgi:hypothetical protein
MTELERYDAGALDLETIRQQFAPKATNLELQYFAQVCRHLNLDPWAGHVYLIGRRQKTRDEHGRDNWRLVHKPQISVAGRRAIASRTGRLVGIEGPYWCGPRRFDDAGAKLPLEWTELWDDDDNLPYAARCLVWPAGWKMPANGTVKWSEFAVYEDAGQTKLGRFWKHSPSHMLGKVAESLALRRGFPEVEAAVTYAEAHAGTNGFETDDEAIVAEAEAEAVAPARPTATGDSPPPSYYDALPEALGQ